MFGYIMAQTEALTEQEKARYGSVYCGLCRSLKARHGFWGRLTLNYDMTFLVLVLSSLYEPEEQSSCKRCIMHPLKKRPCTHSAASDYTADLTLMLAWWNCMDDWEDEKKLGKRLYAALIEKKVRKLEQQYPRQAQAIRESLQQLKDYEDGPKASPDMAANRFGVLMGELFVWKEHDHWATVLRRMGRGLGQFIYIMDACIDYKDDEKHGRPNPLRALGTERTREGDFELLTMLMNDCTSAFEILPLEQDLPLMRNILYQGCWQKYFATFAKKKETKKESTR